MDKRCITTNAEIEQLVSKFQGETLESIKGLVALWQQENNKDWDTYPTSSELNKFKNDKRQSEATTLGWGKYAKNSYEVSTAGDKRFSALNATFKEGTEIAGTDVGGKTIEEVYQKVIKKSEKGKAPSKDSILYNEKLSDKNELENFSYEKGYKPLWEVWASQNEDLMQELAQKSKGKILTDKFANTQVSQARALSEIIEKSYPVEDNTKEAIETLDKAFDFNTFEAPTITTLEEQEAVDTDFDFIERRDRVSLIAQFFSNEIDAAIEEKTKSINAKLEALKDQNSTEIYELKKDLARTSRFDIIKELTPGGIFQRVKEIFTNYLEDSFENRIEAELYLINKSKGADKYSDEKKRAAAEKRALHKTQAYEKIVNNFRALAEESSSILESTEKIIVDLEYLAPKEATPMTDTLTGEENMEEAGSIMTMEESFKDGWMTNYREVSSLDSLSQAVRQVIRTIPKLDYRGKYEKDDLGFQRYLDADYVHATLIDKLRHMLDASDLTILLEELGKTTPWVKQVLNRIKQDEVLYSQFYQDFRKDFVNYWIQKKVMNSDGTYKMQTVSINKPEGVYYLLDEWRDNYENGNKLDEDSVYNKRGEINKENAEKGLKWTEILNNELINLDTEERLKLLNTDKVKNTLLKLLNMLGINARPEVLSMALNDIKDVEGVTFTDPIMLLLPQLNIIFKGIKDDKIKSEKAEDGTEVRGDLINTFGSAYNSIAMLLAEVTNDAIESSVRENDKSYYSHVTPNYLGKVIKSLKDSMKDPARFQEYIQNEFKKYDFFYKNGEWRNDWIKQIVENPQIKEGLEHKVLLNSDKVTYDKWDDLDYTLVLLTEFFGEPNNKNSEIQWGNYHVPILSDSPSAEFIRFRRYDNKSVAKKDGGFYTFEELLLPKFELLIKQELDRISLVNQRFENYQSGDSTVEPIANFDRIGDRIGGAEFKFLPALNDIRFEDEKTFIDKFLEIKKNGTAEDLQSFIHNTLTEVLNTEFEQTYAEWSKLGLLEENSDGKYKHLGVIGLGTGQSTYNSNTVKSLMTAKRLLGNSWTSVMENLLGRYNTNTYINDKMAQRVFDEITDILQDKLENQQINTKDFQTATINLKLRNNAKAKLREYFWNSKFATSQIIQITTSDLAFYSGVEDFQKRFKQVHSPALRLNTNSKYGRKEERTIYLKDHKIVSTAIDNIESVLNDRVKNKEMSSIDRDYIVSQFKKVDVADAQAFRSLSSYRAILDMSGQWTDEMQKAFDNFQKGEWSIEDFNMIWQTKKPFVYTQVSKDSGIEGTSDIKTPVQHKNSEFLLLAMHKLIAGPLGKSPQLTAINKFMESNNIDVVQFESTTKVGKQGVIDINSLNTEAEIIAGLESAIRQYGVENPNVVHSIDYNDYGIQVATPEHVIDAVQLVGTQIRKLITADISNDTIIEINGRELTKEEWLKEYNAIISENIIESFEEVDAIFSDPKNIEKALLDEIKGNPRYGRDMVRACTLNENGQFNIPLYDPVQSQRVQSLLNSIIKNRITKQKVKGGALIQVSNYGLTEELNIVFKNANGDIITYENYKKTHPNATKEEYQKWSQEGREKGDLSIAYLECYMPAYSREFYEPLMKEGTHELDVTKLPEDLRKLIGYRVPTEDKYSMAPLYIKGFLPQQNGSAIMLPSDITTLSGSDFDVDKLYIMLPEFKTIIKYDRNKFASDLVNQLTKGQNLSQESYDEYIQNVKEAIRKGKNADKDSSDYNIWKTFKNSKEDYILEKQLEKVKYDTELSPSQNKRAARNNQMIDLMWGVLTNKDTASKILNPGGFDYQKKAARIITILQSSLESELREELKLNQNESILYALNKLNLDTLNKIAQEYKVPMDPLSPRTQVKLHQQNMTGGALIGIYANHNANHALIQHTELALDEKFGSFILNGKRLTSLHEMTNDSKEYISRNNAGFLAASVDNVKDPVLASLNQNELTADASMLLSRLGYNPIEIGLLLTQPIVLDITHAYFREKREGKSKDTIIDQVLSIYKQKASMMDNVSYDNYKNNMFKIEDLADNLIIAKEVENLEDKSQTSDFRKVEFHKNQVAIGYLFKRIMTASDALSQLVQATRADTSKGGAGPTIADTMNTLQKVIDFQKNVVDNKKSPLINADVISILDTSNDSMSELRSNIESSKLPFLQAFYSLGIVATGRLLAPYFPHYSQSFVEVIQGKNSEGKTYKGLLHYTKNNRIPVKTMNSIYNDLLAYIMSKTSFFGNDLTSNSNGVMKSSSEKRSDFINHFPEYFKEIVAKNPKIGELEFINRLKIIRSNKHNPVDTVIFKNVGQLSSSLREKYMRDWQSLLYMGKDASDLALNLFRYSFYRNGFAFGPNTFIHLAPTIVRQAVPEYISTLRELLTSEDTYEDFIQQYIYNHLDNRLFVPEVADDMSVDFVNDKKEVLNSITITIDENSSNEDMSVVKTMSKDDGPTFFDFITKRIKGKNVYYRLNTSEDNGEGTAVYDRIDPLGYKNSFLEYDYNLSVDEMSSVIKENDRDYTPNTKQDVSAFIDNFDISDYTIDTAPQQDAYQAEALEKAAKYIFGDNVKLELKESTKKEVEEINPNTEFLDENGDPICGGGLD